MANAVREPGYDVLVPQPQPSVREMIWTDVLEDFRAFSSTPWFTIASVITAAIGTCIGLHFTDGYWVVVGTALGGVTPLALLFGFAVLSSLEAWRRHSDWIYARNLAAYLMTDGHNIGYLQPVCSLIENACASGTLAAIARRPGDFRFRAIDLRDWDVLELDELDLGNPYGSRGRLRMRTIKTLEFECVMLKRQTAFEIWPKRSAPCTPPAPPESAQ